MNEKSIRAPFVPVKLKFCRPIKATGGNLPNKCGTKLCIKEKMGAMQAKRFRMPSALLWA